MKRKTLITATSIFLFGVIILTLYYFLYLKKGVIYDLVNIEFSGISLEENTAIKYYGVTPVDKKILLHKDIEENNIPGCFKYIEIVVPDTLISRITSIRTTLKRKVYTYKISELHSPVLSGNTHTYILPSEVKSEGSLLDKISASYPFTILFRTRNAGLLIIFLSMFCIIFFTLFIWWRFITKISQKNNYKKNTAFLQSKKTHYLLLSFVFLFLLLYPILWANQIKIIYFLFICLFISFALQRILNIRNSYVLYFIKVILIIFICFEIIFGILNTKNSPKYFAYTNNILFSDPKLGWKNIPNCHEKSLYKIKESDTVYNVYVSTDEFGRRVSKEYIDSAGKNSMKTKHAVFLGNSFTFEQGLNLSSTFPFLFEQEHPDFKSYNYGTIAYGPHQFCLFFDNGINIINNDAVPEDSGFCMYTYIDDHLGRVYGHQGNESPDIYVKNNKLEYKKRSYVYKRIWWLLNNFLNNSETMKYFNIRITYPKKEKFYKRFAGIINCTADKYWEIKPHGDFYVGLYPEKYRVTDTSWLSFLDKKIKILNIPAPVDFNTNNSYLIKNDDHPTKKLNLYYVEEISKLIFKNK